MTIAIAIATRLVILQRLDFCLAPAVRSTGIAQHEARGHDGFGTAEKIGDWLSEKKHEKVKELGFCIGPVGDRLQSAPDPVMIVQQRNHHAENRPCCDISRGMQAKVNSWESDHRCGIGECKRACRP